MTAAGLEPCDVVVVGGGPAGSTVAAALVHAGWDVVLLDKARFPRDKVCAGWITPAVLEEVGTTPQEYGAHGRTLQPIHGFRVGMVGGRDEPVALRFERAVSYGILRRELDNFLLRRCGARLELGTPLDTLEREGDAWVVNRRFRTPVVVGAGGHFCPVARHLAGEKHPTEPIVVAQELEIPLTESQASACRAEVDVPELYLTEDLLGYGWCFRKQRFLNVGLGRQDRRGLKGHVESFVAWLEEEGRIPRVLATGGGRFKGHAYLIFGQGQRPLVGDGLLLVGDAAGLAYPASGEGIRPAVESALLAAQVLAPLRSFREADLEPYPERLRARFDGGRLGGLLAGLIPKPLLRGVVRRLLLSPRFVERKLIHGWFLHSDEEPLPGLVAPSARPGVSVA